MSTYDVRIDPETGDLPKVPRHIKGDDLILQRVRLRVNTHFGEWFLDQREGLPYQDWAQQRIPNVDSIAAQVATIVRQTPGVNAVQIDTARQKNTSVVVALTAQIGDREVSITIDTSAEDANSQPAIAVGLV